MEAPSEEGFWFEGSLQPVAPRPSEAMARPRHAAEEEFSVPEVEYDGDRVAHERLLLWPVAPGRWVIRSPDADEWAENLDGLGPSSGPRCCRPRRASSGPRGRPPLYRFREKLEERGLRAAMLRCLRVAMDEAGKRLPDVRTVRDAEGVSVPMGDLFRASRMPLLRSPRAAARGLEAAEDDAAETEEECRHYATADEAEERRWLLRAPAGELEVWDDVRPIVGRDWIAGPNRALVKVGGKWALAEAVAVQEATGADARSRREHGGGGVLIEDVGADSAAEQGGSPGGERALGLGGSSPSPKGARAPGGREDDARTLRVDWDAHGERFKTWKQVVQESFAEDFGEERFDGAATSLHMRRAMERQGGHPRAWLEQWMRDKHVEPSDRVAHELRALVEALYLGGCVDQLNVGSLCAVEELCRREAVIVKAYTVLGKTSWDHARYFSGMAAAEEVIASAAGSRRGGGSVPPEDCADASDWRTS